MSGLIGTLKTEWNARYFAVHGWVIPYIIMGGMKLFINSQGVQSLKFGIDKYFHPTPYRACYFLSMLGLKSNQFRKYGPIGFCEL